MMKVTLTWQEAEQKIVDVIVLSRLMAIGRSSVCDVVIKHPTISRQHAFIYAFGRKVYVQNTSHTNTIQVGGALLKTNETAELQDGHKLRLGDIVLEVIEISEASTFKPQLTCGTCDHLVPADQHDCHWCGASLAFADSALGLI